MIAVTKEAIVKRLGGRGLKVTPRRLAIIEVVLSATTAAFAAPWKFAVMGDSSKFYTPKSLADAKWFGQKNRETSR
jgi:hypothetical protein